MKFDKQREEILEIDVYIKWKKSPRRKMDEGF